MYFFFFKKKTAYEMRISDWSSDVCSSDLSEVAARLIETLLDIVDGVAGAGSNGRGLYLADRTRRAIIAMEGSARRVETAAICVSLAGGAGGRKAAERGDADLRPHRAVLCLFRSEEHTSELQSLMRISYAVFC